MMDTYTDTLSLDSFRIRSAIADDLQRDDDPTADHAYVLRDVYITAQVGTTVLPDVDLIISQEWWQDAAVLDWPDSRSKINEAAEAAVRALGIDRDEFYSTLMERAVRHPAVRQAVGAVEAAACYLQAARRAALKAAL